MQVKTTLIVTVNFHSVQGQVLVMHMLWPYVTSVSCHQVKFVISHTQVLKTLTGDDIVQKEFCPGWPLIP